MPSTPTPDLQGFEMIQVMSVVGTALTSTPDSPLHDPGKDSSASL
jgi:hypothetical protein